jgi:hypothetical protein
MPRRPKTRADDLPTFEPVANSFIDSKMTISLLRGDL